MAGKADLHLERQPVIKVHGFHGESLNYFNILNLLYGIICMLHMERAFWDGKYSLFLRPGDNDGIIKGRNPFVSMSSRPFYLTALYDVSELDRFPRQIAFNMTKHKRKKKKLGEKLS